MSSNDQVVVTQSHNGRYFVNLIDIDQQGWGLELGRDLKLFDAAKLAQKVVDEDGVEYGIRFEGINSAAPQEEDHE